jgi:hypothetical protein
VKRYTTSWSYGEGIARRASTDGVHRKSGIGDSNHQNIAGFKTPIEVTPIEGRETLKNFLWEENFADREIGEFQETRKT